MKLSIPSLLLALVAVAAGAPIKLSQAGDISTTNPLSTTIQSSSFFSKRWDPFCKPWGHDVCERCPKSWFFIGEVTCAIKKDWDRKAKRAVSEEVQGEEKKEVEQVQGEEKEVEKVDEKKEEVEQVPEEEPEVEEGPVTLDSAAALRGMHSIFYDGAMDWTSEGPDELAAADKVPEQKGGKGEKVEERDTEAVTAATATTAKQGCGWKALLPFLCVGHEINEAIHHHH